MPKTRIRKIIKDIRSRKGRSALIIIAIMIGVFGVSTLTGMTDLVISQIEDDLDKDAIAMTHVYVVLPEGKLSLEENRAYLDTLNNLPEVEQVEGQAVYPVSWQQASSNSRNFEEGNILAFTETFGDIHLEPVSRIIEGHYPTPGQYEIAVERRFAETHGINTGDKLVFQQPGDDDGTRQEWEITGIVFHPYYVISMAVNGEIAAENNIYANYEDARQIAGFPGLSSIYVRYPDVETAEAEYDRFMEALASSTPYVPVMSYIEDPDDYFLIEEVRLITDVLDILAIVSMLVSGFLVANVINTIVLEQKKQIGVMKSLGASRLDSLFIYTGMALTYGLIGTVFGIAFSLPVASLLAQELAPMASTYIGEFSISSRGVMLGIFLGLVIPVLAALIPVYNGTRVTILEAMTDLGISYNWGQTRLSRWIGAIPVPTTIRQALSNIAQKKGRLALTVFTLTLAVSAFMGVTAVFGSLTDTMDDIFETFNFDVVFTPQEARDFDQIQGLITENIDSVENIYAGYSVAVFVEGYESEDPLTEGSSQLEAAGIDPTSPVIQFDLESGDGWNNDPTRNGIIITRVLADKIGKDAGDTVNITVSGQTHTYPIIGIDSYSGDLLFFNWEELATIAGFVNSNNEPLPGTFYLDLKGEPDPEQVESVIEDIDALLLASGIQGTYRNQPEVEEEQLQQIGLLSLIFNMTSGLMALIGAVGLLTTLSMAVFERQKEIGVMRSIGAGSSTIVTQFLVEGLMVGIIAWLAAVPLSVGLGYVLYDAMADDTGFTFTYPLQVILMGFIGVMIIAAVASIYPSIAAARKNVSEILRYQ